MPARLSRQDLHDYVDGRLDDADRARIASYLANHPEEAAEAEAYRAQLAGLAALYDPVLEEPVPDRMRELLRRHRAGARRQHFRAAAAAVLLLALAGGGGWWLRGILPDDEPALSRLVADAEQSYRLYAGSAVASDAGLQPAATLAPIIARRLGTAVELPELERAGMVLAAMRFVPTPGGDAAVLLYRDAQGRSATLLVMHVEARDHAARRLTTAPVATLYRVRGGIGYALTLPAAALDDRLATALAGS